jgi:hypothetical protein
MRSLVPPQPQLQPQAPSLHRNNAAEWLLWLVLLPFVPIAWFVGCRRQRFERTST